MSGLACCCALVAGVGLWGETCAPVFEAKALRIEFAAASDGFGLRRVVNNAAPDVSFANSREDTADLWRLRLVGIGLAGTNETVFVDNRASCARSFSRNGNALQMSWSAIALPGESNAVDVAVRIWAEGELVHWTINPLVKSQRWALHTTQFPIVRHVVDDGEADVLVPWKNMGARLVRKYRASVEKPLLAYSPSCKPPVMAFFKGDVMLYLAAHDANWNFKEMRYSRDNDFHFAVEAEDSGIVGKARNPDGGFVIGCGRGDWWQAARLYRNWAHGQKWCARGRLAENRYFNRRAAETELWTLSHGDANLYTNHVAAMARLWPDVGKSAKWQRMCGRGGPKLQNCIHTPDWLHCTAEEAAASEFARSHGFLVMPYTNGRLWHETLESWPTALPYACLDQNGKRHAERYTGGDYAVMCPACEFWRDKVAAVTRQFCEVPAFVNAVYLDQVSCSPPYPCRDAAHAHPIGGGGWWAEGIRTMMEPIHAEARAKGVVLTSEQFGDFTLDLFDAFLNATEHEPDDVPFFPAVYSGYAVYYGTEVHWKDSDAARFALSARTFLWGVANGWIPGYEVANPAFRSHAEIYYAFARARKAARDYFVYGSLEDALRPLGEMPTSTFTWYRTETNRGKATYTNDLPTVMGAVWRNADRARKAVVAVNISSAAQTVRFRVPSGACPQAKARELPGQAAPRFAIAGDVVTLTLAPRQMALLEFSGATWIQGVTDKDPLSYTVGEPIVFTLNVTGDIPLADGTQIPWKRTGDDGVETSGVWDGKDSLVVTTALKRAGFVRLRAEAKAVNGKPVFFDGGAAADVAALRQSKAEPADYDQFWTKCRTELASVPIRSELKEVFSPAEGVRLYEARITCPGGTGWTTGYLSVPTNGAKVKAVASFFGYYSSWGIPARTPPKKVKCNELHFWVTAHGFELGRDEAYYTAFHERVKSNGYGHGFDPVQNARPETSYFHGMALRAMRAVEYLKTRPEWNGHDLIVTGGSQASLQSIWCAAFVPGVTGANIQIPWLCDVGGHVNGRNHGPWYPEWAPGLDYFDQVNAAKRVPKTCQVTIPRIGLGDYTSPPCGATIMYAALDCPKSATWVQGSTHGYIPPQAQKTNRTDGWAVKNSPTK